MADKNSLVLNQGDLYIPRRCSATGRLIGAKEYRSVQISVPDIDNNGVIKNTYKQYVICSDLRIQGYADECLNTLFRKDNVMPQ